MLAHRQKKKRAQADRLCYQNLVRGLGGGFGARLQELFYSLDVGGNVYAYRIVHGFYDVHVEAVFQPAQLLELFDAF